MEFAGASFSKDDNSDVSKGEGKLDQERKKRRRFGQSYGYSTDLEEANVCSSQLTLKQIWPINLVSNLLSKCVDQENWDSSDQFHSRANQEGSTSLLTTD